MEEILNQITETLLKSNDIFIYIFLFLSSIIENLFPPIPGDTITAFGAFLVGTGRLNYYLVYIITAFGSVLGFMMLFWIGRFLGIKFFQEKNYKHFSAEKIAEAESWIIKYGYFVVFGNRFLPGVRSVISIVTGISQLKSKWVFLLALASSSIWNLIWIHTGYLLGNNWDIVKEKMGKILGQYNIIVTVIIITMVAIYIIYKKKRKTQTENETP